MGENATLPPDRSSTSCIIVNKCLDKLPPQTRRIFEMSRIQGMSYAEIAQELDISVRTVENHIYRSLVIMKIELKDYMTALLFALLLILNK